MHRQDRPHPVNALRIGANAGALSLAVEDQVLCFAGLDELLALSEVCHGYQAMVASFLSRLRTFKCVLADSACIVRGLSLVAKHTRVLRQLDYSVAGSSLLDSCPSVASALLARVVRANSRTFETLLGVPSYGDVVSALASCPNLVVFDAQLRDVFEDLISVDLADVTRGVCQVLRHCFKLIDIRLSHLDAGTLLNEVRYPHLVQRLAISEFEQRELLLLANFANLTALEMDGAACDSAEAFGNVLEKMHALTELKLNVDTSEREDWDLGGERRLWNLPSLTSLESGPYITRLYAPRLRRVTGGVVAEQWLRLMRHSPDLEVVKTDGLKYDESSRVEIGRLFSAGVWPRLVELDMAHLVSCADVRAGVVAARWSQLKSLQLTLITADCEPELALFLVDKLPLLEKLWLCVTVEDREFVLAIAAQLPQMCTRYPSRIVARELRSLHLNLCSDSTVHFLDCPNLTSLWLGGPLAQIVTLGLSSVPVSSRFPKLEQLYLRDLVELDEIALLAFLTALPSLRILQVQDCAAITPLFLFGLVSVPLPKLKSLTAAPSELTKFSAASIIALLRTMPQLVHCVLSRATIGDDDTRDQVMAARKKQFQDDALELTDDQDSWWSLDDSSDKEDEDENE